MPILLLVFSLCWDVHPETNLFRLYKDNVAIQDVTGTRTSVELQLTDTVTFTVTALKDGLESLPSNPLTFHAPRMQMRGPGTVTFTRPIAIANRVFKVESSTDLKTWIDEQDYLEMIEPIDEKIERVVVNFNHPDPMKFYRVRIDIIKEGCAAL